ncbi:hypothetical protein Poly59_61520 [Rubripirellula reticaptiva]|uniref:Uncharacterized protein n=1 Tax=Rubripirellula reticaptiva TaxID=2528013 RepID=A0A5C6E6R1_9BACT|nr:hypothetical protein Poly59_61520 [Rubripirellula reticaptiva]
MGCYGAAVVAVFFCLQVNRRRPQNPTVIRRKIHERQQMQLTILQGIWATLYVAIALASFRYSTNILTSVTYAVCVLTFAGAAVLAFDRRSTPLVAFVLFGVASLTFSELFMPAVIPVMLALGTTTGSNEYNNLSSLMICHYCVIFAFVGYFFGLFVVRQRLGRTANTRANQDGG